MPVPSPSSLNVLVIDDHMIIRQAIAQTLSGMGFKRIDTAANADEAEAKIRAENYDIIFVDWVMPGKSGFTLMQEHRLQKKFDATAFVMVTAEADEKQVIDALKAGATSYIIKPITADTFTAKVRKVLEWLDKKRNPGG